MAPAFFRTVVGSSRTPERSGPAHSGSNLPGHATPAPSTVQPQEQDSGHLLVRSQRRRDAPY